MNVCRVAGHTAKNSGTLWAFAPLKGLPLVASTCAIRPAKPGDEPEVIRLFAEAQEHHVALAPDVFRPVTDEDLRELLGGMTSQDSMSVLVAELDGVICGFALLGIREAPASPLLQPRRWVEIEALGVSPQYRGRGIGSALMSAVERWAADRNVSRLQLGVWESNAGALRLYERLGFTTARRMLAREVES